MTRTDIFNLIINERAAQDAQWGGRDHDRQHDRLDWGEFITRQLQKIDHMSETDAYRSRMVKVAALAVAAIEASIDDLAEAATEPNPPAHPEGDYAVVELFGHIRHVGRVTETQRFGESFCTVEPIEDGEFKLPVTVGGKSIFRITAVSPEQAFAMAPTSWAYRNRNAPQLPAPQVQDADYEDDDFEREF